MKNSADWPATVSHHTNTYAYYFIINFKISDIGSVSNYSVNRDDDDNNDDDDDEYDILLPTLWFSRHHHMCSSIALSVTNSMPTTDFTLAIKTIYVNRFQLCRFLADIVHRRLQLLIESSIRLF